MKDLLQENQISVQLDSNGISVFRRYAVLVKWMYMGTFLFSFFILAELLVRNIYLTRRGVTFTTFSFFFRYLYPMLQVIITILLIAQMYHLRKFVRKVEESYREIDSDKFNLSFGYLYRSGVLTIIQFVLTLGMYFIQLVADVLIFRFNR